MRGSKTSDEQSGAGVVMGKRNGMETMDVDEESDRGGKKARNEHSEKARLSEQLCGNQ